MPTLPPPPITQADRARAEARQSWDAINHRMIHFAPVSSLPALDGLAAADAAQFLEQDWPHIVNAIYGPQNGLSALCTRPRNALFERCSPGSRELAVAWYIVPEGGGKVGWASCQYHLPQGLPARHWYSVAPGMGNLNAQAAVKTYSVIAAERRRIARLRRETGGGQSAAYYQARLNIALPDMLGLLARRSGLEFDAYLPKPMPELPPLRRYDDAPPPPVPTAAAEQAGVDGACPTCGNRNTPAPASFTARLRALAAF